MFSAVECICFSPYQRQVEMTKRGLNYILAVGAVLGNPTLVLSVNYNWEGVGVRSLSTPRPGHAYAGKSR